MAQSFPSRGDGDSYTAEQPELPLRSDDIPLRQRNRRQQPHPPVPLRDDFATDGGHSTSSTNIFSTPAATAVLPPPPTTAPPQCPGSSLRMDEQTGTLMYSPYPKVKAYWRGRGYLDMRPPQPASADGHRSTSRSYEDQPGMLGYQSATANADFLGQQGAVRQLPQRAFVNGTSSVPIVQPAKASTKTKTSKFDKAASAIPNNHTFLNILVDNLPKNAPAIVARLDDDTYITPEDLPYAVQVTLDREIESWKTGRHGERIRRGTVYGTSAVVAWYERLVKRSQNEIADIDECLHFKYHNLRHLCWPVGGGTAKYACMGCTNTCRACCIWDPTRRQVVMLPLAPSVRAVDLAKNEQTARQMTDVQVADTGMAPAEADTAYWYRGAQNFTTEYQWARELF
ncbi:hypothetical protein LTR36_009215 [Oleoguttula mirabilis]|uniref:Uncharacterized protein n=1 Tax=Oleoguttula mirabilis TaxID=1507867 RepID=A0AAV9J680_9PEZI|nr:hypothetical protein LTR36_009215 [Oleoguttula mirabilis]